MAYFRVTTVFMFVNIKTNLLYENSIDRSIDFYPYCACVTSYARNPPRFFTSPIDFQTAICYESIKPYYHGGSV